MIRMYPCLIEINIKHDFFSPIRQKRLTFLEFFKLRFSIQLKTIISVLSPYF